MTEDEKKAPILMGNHHPQGWKFEELMVKLRQEIHIKQSKIKDDPRPVAKVVFENNEAIMELLRRAESLQRASLKALDTIRAENGPEMQPRIGKGSEGA